MTDTALPQLLRLADRALPTLLVLDENAGPLPPNPFAQVQVLSNRVDTHAQAQTAGWPSRFCDFEFAASLPAFSQALYRISKEKRVVEHVLQSLWQRLPEGGVLLCCGYKNDGIKTFAKRMQEAWQVQPELERGEQKLHVYRLVKGAAPALPLNAADYHELLPIGLLREDPVYSKPGIFAWDRFDQGSSFLLQQLRAFLAEGPQAQSGLDLGCGYGLLALALLQAGCTRVVATDNNAAALLACSDNLQDYAASASVEVVAGDCADSISERFDLILCNPPFHQGFAVEQDLTDRFLAAAQRLLQPQGRALFVVNMFIPLERKASGLFGKIDVIADNGRFRVIALRQPRR
jgi:16S rRNA (guanine1207-N2)-methyltransferase